MFGTNTDLKHIPCFLGSVNMLSSGNTLELQVPEIKKNYIYIYIYILWNHQQGNVTAASQCY
jgi:hypothetical protein